MASKGVLTSSGSLALGEINQRGIVGQKDTLPRKQMGDAPLVDAVGWGAGILITVQRLLLDPQVVITEYFKSDQKRG